jgi:hypothetical protein
MSFCPHDPSRNVDMVVVIFTQRSVMEINQIQIHSERCFRTLLDVRFHDKKQLDGPYRLYLPIMDEDVLGYDVFLLLHILSPKFS